MTQNQEEAAAIDRLVKVGPRHELRADDIVIWRGNRFPTREEIDRAAASACERGWNGTTLDHFCNDAWMDFVEPSEDVLS